MPSQPLSEADRPYPARRGRLPRHLQQVTKQWLSSLLAHRYPGLEVESMQVLDVRNGHTTKLRVQPALNEVGRGADIPPRLCLKSNWSEGFESGEICELEARFYHFAQGWSGAPLPATY
jgi:hypothetical protein